MGRNFCIFIFTCTLIVNIFLCTSTRNGKPENQIPLLKEQERNEIKTKPSIFLIYPTPISFKHYILPHLSSDNVIKMYGHVSKFRPELDLSKWFEGFAKNSVVDFRNSFEKKILFRAPDTFQFKWTILYSPQNKSAINTTIVGLDHIPLDTFCAFLENNQNIVPLEKNNLNINVTLWSLCDLEFHKFFVCDENFVTISCGKMSLEALHTTTVGLIWEAKNLRGWKNFFVTLRYFLTIPFIKYLKLISPLVNFFDFIWSSFCHDCQLQDLEDCLNFCCCFCGILHDIFVIFGWYIYRFFVFHTITLPFHALAILIETFLFDKNMFSLLTYSTLHTFCFLFSSLFFPRSIDNFLKFELSSLTFKVKQLSFLENFKLVDFDIEPKNTMWSLPFLAPRNRTDFFYLLFVFIIYEFLFSLILKLAFKNWVPHSDQE